MSHIKCVNVSHSPQKTHPSRTPGSKCALGLFVAIAQCKNVHWRSSPFCLWGKSLLQKTTSTPSHREGLEIANLHTPLIVASC